jgi:hypothetical protein
MIRRSVMPEDDLARKKEATKLISLGLLIAMGIGVGGSSNQSYIDS